MHIQLAKRICNCTHLQLYLVILVLPPIFFALLVSGDILIM